VSRTELGPRDDKILTASSPLPTRNAQMPCHQNLIGALVFVELFDLRGYRLVIY
jgi:hypothetical protein